MCGIVGALDLKHSRNFSSELLLSMTRSVAHRGPDDEQVQNEPGIALGARRLSIIDIAGGRQPIANETGEVWVTFNGELFNYPELRQNLLSKGHQLTTHCDTEAWVHLYEDYGEEMFSKVKGQFAVALWDRKNKTLILGRDRVGICPLFYAEHDGWLLWASEIKGLLASGLIQPVPDPKGIDHLFNFFCTGATRTCFKGIQSIPPGHYLKVKEGQIKLVQHWDLDFPDSGEERRVKDSNIQVLLEEFDYLLRQSVKRRLRADVPVVSYLSGGLDSTIILGLCSEERKKNIPSFTIALDRAGHDESLQASESARFLDSPQTTLILKPEDIVNAYPELILAAEVPVIETASACLMRLAATVHQQGYKVALTGEGADEALAGYPWFKVQKWIRGFFRRISGPYPLILLRGLLLRSIGGGSDHWPPLQATAGVRSAQQNLYEWIAQSRIALYDPEMWNRLDGYSAYQDLNLTNDRIHRWHFLNQSLYLGYKLMLPGLLLSARGDRAAMHSSVETRYPFLDEDIIDFCARLSPKYKLHGMTDKWLLRQLAKKILPKTISKRPKGMFRALRSGIFLGPDRPPWVDELLSEESLKATGYFNPSAVTGVRAAQSRFPEITPRRIAFDVGMMGVIATQLWHHIFCGGGLATLSTWSPPPR